MESEKLVKASDVKEYFKRAIFGADQKIDKWVDAIPAADVRPVVRGEWLEADSRSRSCKFICSACRNTSYDPQPTRVVGWVKRCRYAFCPNCGAVMKGAER